MSSMRRLKRQGNLEYRNNTFSTQSSQRKQSFTEKDGFNTKQQNIHREGLQFSFRENNLVLYGSAQRTWSGSYGICIRSLR